MNLLELLFFQHDGRYPRCFLMVHCGISEEVRFGVNR